MGSEFAYRSSDAAAARAVARGLLVAACVCLGACASRGGHYYQDDGPPEHAPAGLAQTPDAVPRVEPLNPRANRPYTALGRSYTPDTGDAPFEQRGMASWYGRQYHGNPTASGEPYDMYAMSAAHPTLPIPSYARVTRVNDGRSVIVRINDRGPFLQDRVIDLSYAAATRLGIVGPGSGEVTVHKITARDIAAGNTGAAPALAGAGIGRTPAPVLPPLATEAAISTRLVAAAPGAGTAPAVVAPVAPAPATPPPVAIAPLPGEPPLAAPVAGDVSRAVPLVETPAVPLVETPAVPTGVTPVVGPVAAPVAATVAAPTAPPVAAPPSAPAAIQVPTAPLAPAPAPGPDGAAPVPAAAPASAPIGTAAAAPVPAAAATPAPPTAAPPPVAAAPAEAGAPDSGNGPWAVQLGAFAVKANAEALRDQMTALLAKPEADGLPPQSRHPRIAFDGKLHHVLAGAFDGRAAAQGAARALQRYLGRDTSVVRR